MELLLSFPETESPYETARDLAIAIDDEECCKKLLNKFLVPIARLNESVVTKIQTLVVKMTWLVLKTTLLQFMDKMRKYEVGSFALDLALVMDDKDECNMMLGKYKENKSHLADSDATKLLSLMKKFSWPSLKKSILQIMENSSGLGRFAMELPIVVTDEKLCKMMIERYFYFSPSLDEGLLSKQLEVISKYSWPALQATVLQLMDKVDVSRLPGFVNLFNRVDSLDVTVCERVMKKMTINRFMMVNDATRFAKTHLFPILKLVLLFPKALVKLSKEMANMPCLENLDLCSEFALLVAETFLKDTSALTTVMAALEETFLSNAGKLNKLSMKSEAVNKMVKVMTKLDRMESLQALVTLVLAQPDHQALLANMLKIVTADTVPLPVPLLTLVKARVAFLQPRVERDPPEFSWRQKKAVIPGHEKIEQFFRGDQQSYTYRGFTGVTVARKWARTHCQDKGTCASFTAGKETDI